MVAKKWRLKHILKGCLVEGGKNLAGTVALLVYLTISVQPWTN